MAFARQHFTLQQPVGDQSQAPLVAHLRQVARTKGVDPDEFVRQHFPAETPSEPPETLVAQWQIFLDLSASRSSNGYAPSPVPYTEIAAWQQVYGIELQPWEVNLLRGLDLAWLKAWHDRSRESRAEDS